jgi:hypothetical protein
MTKRHLAIVAVSITVVTLVKTSVVLSADGTPSVEIIYDAHGFESPEFDLRGLVGQDGWVGVAMLSSNAAVVGTGLPYAGRQSVEVRGAQLVHQDSVNQITQGYYDAIGSYRRPCNYDAGAHGFPVIRIQAAVRVDGPLSPGTNFLSASISARGLQREERGNASGTVGIGELAISSDGHVYGYSGAEDSPVFQASAPAGLGAWHTLAIDIDFRGKNYTFLVDGNVLPGGPFRLVSAANTNTLARASLVVYAAAETATLGKSNYVVHFDDFSIRTR